MTFIITIMIGRQALKFGVQVRHQKWHIDLRAFPDCVTYVASSTVLKTCMFRACGRFMKRFSRQAIRQHGCGGASICHKPAILC